MESASANVALSANPTGRHSAPIAAAKRQGRLDPGRSSTLAVAERTWTPSLLRHSRTRSTGTRRENATWRWHAAEDVRLPWATSDGGDLLARQGRSRLAIDERALCCKYAASLFFFSLPAPVLSVLFLRFFPFDGWVDVSLRDEHHRGADTLRRGVSLSSFL